jgi:hypothetical protein
MMVDVADYSNYAEIFGGLLKSWFWTTAGVTPSS